MGNYTGLRGEIMIKPEFHDNFKTSSVVDFEWDEILDENHPYLLDYRKNFIPFGSICYLDWDDVPVTFENGVLAFTCSLKNYNNTIDTFINTVLPIIGDAWYLEEMYEYDDESTIHAHNEELL